VSENCVGAWVSAGHVLANRCHPGVATQREDVTNRCHASGVVMMRSIFVSRVRSIAPCGRVRPVHRRDMRSLEKANSSSSPHPSPRMRKQLAFSTRSSASATPSFPPHAGAVIAARKANKKGRILVKLPSPFQPASMHCWSGESSVAQVPSGKLNAWS
jgi:hypothetical protein